MIIESNKYYAILCLSNNGLCLDWFKDKVYLGRYVLNAYNKIKDKHNYKICIINKIKEVENE